MAKQKKVVEDIDQNNLAQAVLDAVNVKFKDSSGKAANFLDDSAIAANVTGWIPTGSTMLDLAISNRQNGGWPCGKIIEIMGQSASGKSLLACYALASTQRMGGLAVYFDTEAAASQEYLQAIGVNTSKLLYVNLEQLEDVFASIEDIIAKVRSADRKKPVTIVVDSIMGATTKIEMDSGYDKDGWATSKALILSKAMRKLTGLIAREQICLILTNQIRTNLGVTFGNNETTSGGLAVGFHASVRVKLKSLGKLKGFINELETPIGIKTQATVIKNRIGPPLRSVEYDIFFNSGIDDEGSWLTALKAMKIVTVAGPWHTLHLVNPDTGEMTTKKFSAKQWPELLQDLELKEALYKAICKAYIMEYNTEFTDISVDETFVDHT